MGARVDRELLVRCCALPCSWQNDGTVESCPYRSPGSTPDDRFRHDLCKLFSTPGPHSVSRVARAIGVTNAKVEELEQLGMRKVLRTILNDPALMHTPTLRLMVEQMQEHAI